MCDYPTVHPLARFRMAAMAVFMSMQSFLYAKLSAGLAGFADRRPRPRPAGAQCRPCRHATSHQSSPAASLAALGSPSSPLAAPTARLSAGFTAAEVEELAKRTPMRGGPPVPMAPPPSVPAAAAPGDAAGGANHILALGGRCSMHRECSATACMLRVLCRACIACCIRGAQALDLQLNRLQLLAPSWPSALAAVGGAPGSCVGVLPLSSRGAPQ
jgi:hypothetical protein